MSDEPEISDAPEPLGGLPTTLTAELIRAGYAALPSLPPPSRTFVVSIEIARKVDELLPLLAASRRRLSRMHRNYRGRKR